jgi:hypothetical protein
VADPGRHQLAAGVAIVVIFVWQTAYAAKLRLELGA